jgi:hypothetical protein
VTATIEVATNAAATTWDDISDAVERTSMRFGGIAYNGEIGQGFGFDLKDPSAIYSLPARRVVRITVGGNILFRGRVLAKGVSRGLARAGDAREFDVELVDANAHLYGIIVDGWVRPAETVAARVQALLDTFLSGSPRASTNLADTYFNDAIVYSLPAKTYTDTDPNGVLDHVARMAACIYHVAVDGDDDALFFDVPTSPADAAGLSVTDVSPNYTTSFPPRIENAQATQDGAELTTGLRLKYGDAQPPAFIDVVDAAAEAAHDYWRVPVFSGGASTVGEATTEANGVLTEVKTEELRFGFSILLDESQTDLIRAGQTFSVRSAGAGVTTPRTVRAGRVEWEEAGAGDKWFCHIESGPLERIARRLDRKELKQAINDSIGNPGGQIGEAIDDHCCDLPPYVCVPTDPTIYWDDGSRNGIVDIAANDSGGWSNSLISLILYEGVTYRLKTFITTEGGDNHITSVGVSGTGLVAQNDHGSQIDGDWNPGNATFPIESTFTPPPGTPYEVFPSADRAFFALNNTTLLTGWVNVEYVSGIDPRFPDGLVTCDGDPPEVGQRTGEQVTVGPDGEIVTNYPYEPGSLHVSPVGSVTPTETDPAAGEATVPLPEGTVIVVHYQIADPTPTGGTNASPTPGTVNVIPQTVTEALLYRHGGGDLIMAHGNVGSAETFDLADGNLHTATLDQNSTFTFTSPASGAGRWMTMILEGGTGSPYAVTWPGSVTWIAGAAPDEPDDGDAILMTFLTVDGGTSWVGMVAGGSSSGASASTTPSSILLASDHGVPFAFDDILQASDGSDFLYASE